MFSYITRVRARGSHRITEVGVGRDPVQCRGTRAGHTAIYPNGWAPVVPEEVQVGYEEEFLPSKDSQALEEAAQGGGAVPLPEGLQSRLGVVLSAVMQESAA